MFACVNLTLSELTKTLAGVVDHTDRSPQRPHPSKSGQVESKLFYQTNLQMMYICVIMHHGYGLYQITHKCLKLKYVVPYIHMSFQGSITL